MLLINGKFSAILKCRAKCVCHEGKMILQWNLDIRKAKIVVVDVRIRKFTSICMRYYSWIEIRLKNAGVFV